jgi:hypothetical protein
VKQLPFMAQNQTQAFFYVCPNFGMLVTVDPNPQNAKPKKKPPI